MTQIEDQPPPMKQPGVSSVQALVRADLEERERIGTARYGTALQPVNGRDAMVDAYQEVLDLACYIRQFIAEQVMSEQIALQLAQARRDIERKDDLIAEFRRQMKGMESSLERCRADLAAARAGSDASARGWGR